MFSVGKAGRAGEIFQDRQAGTLSAGGCESWCTKRGREELPQVRDQRQWPRVPGCDGAGTAKRSYPASEVSGGREQTPRVRGQGRPGEATWHPRPRAVTLRSHPEPEARGGSWEEPPTPEARARSREEQPEDFRSALGFLWRE